MAADPAQRRATYEDLLEVPEHELAQLIDGELYVHPRPAGPHARAASVLGMDLGGPFDRGRGGPGGWVFLDEPELHFGEDVLVPDIAAWRRERAPTLDASYFEVAPDWICEVASPRTALLDRRRKLPIYAARGVGYVWIVDPAHRSVEVFRLDGETYRLITTRGEDELARLEPFEAVELSLGALWVESARQGSER